MRLLSLVFCLFLFVNTAYANFEDSVVRISSTLYSYDYTKPWEPQKRKVITGSGVIIKDNLILTAAHVVSNARTIEIKKSEQRTSYFAKVKYISNQADLALLELFDENFFKDTKPLSLGSSLNPSDKVFALGFPNSTNKLVKKEGRVLKYEQNPYSWSNEKLQALEIAIDITRGNSGGPILKDGKIIAIAMQIPKTKSKKAYSVPSSIIKTFLEDTKNKKIDGFHSNSNSYQYLENQALQEYYKTDDIAMLVTGIDLNEKQLKIDDIILKVGKKSLSELSEDEFYQALHSKPVGKTIRLKIKRDNKLLTINYKLNKTKKLIEQEFNKKPRYYLLEGLVFTPITRNYLHEIGMKQYEMNMLFYEQKRNPNYIEKVAWMDIKFPNKHNIGYNSKVEIVDKVNGIKVKSFKHFINLAENTKKKYIVIDFVNKKHVVLEKEEALKGEHN